MREAFARIPAYIRERHLDELMKIIPINAFGLYSEKFLDRSASTPFFMQGHITDTVLAAQLYLVLNWGDRDINHKLQHICQFIRLIN